MLRSILVILSLAPLMVNNGAGGQSFLTLWFCHIGTHSQKPDPWNSSRGATTGWSHEVLQVVPCATLGSDRHLIACIDSYIYYKTFSANGEWNVLRKGCPFEFAQRLQMDRPQACILCLHRENSILKAHPSCWLLVVFSQQPSFTHGPIGGHPPIHILLSLLMALTLFLL